VSLAGVRDSAARRWWASGGLVGWAVEHRLGLGLQRIADPLGVVDDRTDRVERVRPVAVAEERHHLGQPGERGDGGRVGSTAT
jgi:hypothetical protein